MPRSATQTAVRQWLLGAAVVALAVTNLLPIAWGVLTSIKPDSAILTYPPTVIGFEPTLEHYVEALTGATGPAILASLFFGILATAVGLVVSTLCAYALDRLRFRLQRAILYVIVGCIPLSLGAATILIPNYIYFASAHLINHWYTLPLIYVGLNIPLAIWVMKGAMEAVPRELDEAARMDGATRMGLLFRVVLPVCRPGLVAAGLLIFIGSWNEFVAGTVMVTDPSLRPIQVAIYQYISVLGRLWGPLAASATLAILPIMILVIVLGRHLVAGLMSGAVKG